MAFIVVKGPSTNLCNVIERIGREGYSLVCDGLSVHFPNQPVKIISPYMTYGTAYLYYCFDAHRRSPYVTLVYDVYDQIPLADAQLITCAKTFFDAPEGCKELSIRNIEGILYLASAVKHDLRVIFPHCSKRELAFSDITPDMVCDDCGHPIMCGIMSTRVERGEGTEHEPRRLKFCPTCENFDLNSSIVIDPKVATPVSAVARFLLDQMAIHFSLETLVYPNTVQHVLLIGNDYFISYMPLPPFVRAKYYHERRRLRVTKRVLKDIFTSANKSFPSKRKQAFDEFTMDAHLPPEVRKQIFARTKKEPLEPKTAPQPAH